MMNKRSALLLGLLILMLIAGPGIVTPHGEELIVEATAVRDPAPDETKIEGGVHSKPLIVGRLEYAGQAFRLGAGIDEAAPYADISSLVRPDGRFVLNRFVLEHIHGDTLRAGQHELHLAVEALNGESPGAIDVKFVYPANPS
jgi:hypothetical protein